MFDMFGCCGPRTDQNRNVVVDLKAKDVATQLLYQAEDFKATECPENDVVVKVSYVTLNPSVDKGRLNDAQTPGCAFSGKVKWVGTKVTTFAKGDVVYGWSDAGAFHDWVKVPSTNVQKVPADVEEATASCIPYQIHFIQEADKLVKDAKVTKHKAEDCNGACTGILQNIVTKKAAVWADASKNETGWTYDCSGVSWGWKDHTKLTAEQLKYFSGVKATVTSTAADVVKNFQEINADKKKLYVVSVSVLHDINEKAKPAPAPAPTTTTPKPTTTGTTGTTGTTVTTGTV